MEKLYQSLYRLYTSIKGFVDQPLNNRNPLELRLRLTLEEELQALMAALQVLSRSPIDLDELKELLTIIYHSDEAAQPTARAWVRASNWMHSANPSDLQGVEVRFRRMFRDLKEAAAIVEEIYGEKETKYIVPIEYRRRVRRGA